MILQFFFFFLLLSFLAIFLTLYYPIYKLRELKKIPGPPRHWLFGNILLSETGEERLERYYNYSTTYPDLYLRKLTIFFFFY